MIGNPVGLPTKVAGGATVRNNNPSKYFEANVDAYGGNSGSAVLNARDLKIEGLLVRGNPDFVYAGGCVASNQCPDTGCPGWEEVTRTTEFAHLIPPSQDLEFEIFFEQCDGLAEALTSNSEDNCWMPPPLEPNTEYCWRVTAKSECGETPGPLWSFTTVAPPSVVSSHPPNCAIDARQPSEPNGSVPDGWDSIAITFSGDTSAILPGDFDAYVFEGDPSPPTITDVELDGTTVTLRLSRRIPMQKWTCIRYVPTGRELCLNHLPANVSADNTSGPVDILWLIDCLNGFRTCELWQCDANRTGLCDPADILRVIDLLNGAALYDPWLHASIAACPSAG
jgi:hypothetical protein